MSARMASSNLGELDFWHERYKTNEVRLDNIIAKVINNANYLGYDTTSVSLTNNANIKLVEMESAAFDYLEEGDYKSAQEILFSEEYSKYKKVYSLSITKFVENIQQNLKKTLLTAYDVVFYTKISAIIVFLLLGLVWIYTMVNIRRWHEATRIAFEDATSSKEILQTKNHELERFNFIVAHDLKESLRSVFSFSQLIEAEKNTKDAKDYLSRIQNACLSMEALIEDLLSYTKINKSEINVTNVSLQNLIDKICNESLNSLLTSKNVQIIYSDLPEVKSDIIKINQVFSNIISNGVIYNNSEEIQVVITAEKLGGYWEVSFKDNGIGVDEEYFESIFDLFTRLNDKRNYKGNGLGLAICKKNMDMLGGSVFLRKSNKGGSEFVVRICNKS
jgi:signal transduction histidine kinase